MIPGQGFGLFSEAGEPTLGLAAPIGDSGARRGVMDNSDDNVRRCRCAEIDASFGICASAVMFEDLRLHRTGSAEPMAHISRESLRNAYSADSVQQYLPALTHDTLQSTAKKIASRIKTERQYVIHKLLTVEL